MSCTHRRCLSKASRWVPPLFGFGLLLCQNVIAAPQLPNQTKVHRPHPQTAPASTATSQSQYKGIWEPVNYSQDLRLTDVFFLTRDVGYVSGWGGTILKTVDGGKTWTPQLGGDPQSQEPQISHLRFLDQRHGWAVQSSNPPKLLRTVDGENWEQVAALPPGWGLLGYQFVSPSVGVLLDGNNNVSHIFRTVDAGRNWKEVFPPERCRINAQVQGLTRQLNCTLWTLNMVSPAVGFILGRVGYEKPEVLVIAKTTDGGASWSLTSVQGPEAMFDYNGSQWMSAFFTEENSGVLATGGDRLYALSDGGQSWSGLTGTAPGPVRFADPEVGWSFNVNKLSYTTDGGKRWSSRGVSFPAWPYAFSLPRRDRAYVVGDHGMIYRYSVVPVDYQAAANSIDAPAMPGYDSPLNGELATVRSSVSALAAQMQTSLGISAPPQLVNSASVAGTSSTDGDSVRYAAANQSGQSANSTGFQQPTQSPAGQYTAQNSVPQSAVNSTAPDATPGGFQQDTGSSTANAVAFQQTAGQPVGGVVASCCAPALQNLQSAANVFATDLPMFSGKFRNLNLMTAGLQFINDLLQHTNALKLAINNLGRAPDKQSAAAALGALSGQLNGMPADVNGGFVQDTSSAFPPQAAQVPTGFAGAAQQLNQPAGNQAASGQPSAAQQPNAQSSSAQSGAQAANPSDQLNKAAQTVKDKLKKKLPW